MGQLSKDEVFALAVQRYSDTVFRAAMHNCSCTADAEDVVQDVFEKLLNHCPPERHRAGREPACPGCL